MIIITSTISLVLLFLRQSSSLSSYAAAVSVPPSSVSQSSRTDDGAQSYKSESLSVPSPHPTRRFGVGNGGPIPSL